MTKLDIPKVDLDNDAVQLKVKEMYEYETDKPKSRRDMFYKEFTLDDGQIWTSWTVRDHIYRKKMNELPTMARGLFTKSQHADKEEKEEKYQIMARGYDKFFNVSETDITQWHSIEKETTGPYEVTAKENGCIIFIASLSKEKVIATSKHAVQTKHANKGHEWVLSHLEKVKKSEKDLAEWLYDRSITLVAELCDDEFEEHILPYTDKSRGLYLHGINYNKNELSTLPSLTVQLAADEFGFHRTEFKLFDTIDKVKEFGQKMQLTGLYDDKEIEGAVVRCKREGKDFMFKIKNDQYMMYREYREVTNAMLEVNDDGTVSIIQPTKMPRIKHEKTNSYIEWMRKAVVDNPEWFKNYKSQQKGIIEVRQEFEKYWEYQQPALQ